MSVTLYRDCERLYSAYGSGENKCALLTVGVKHGQMHPLEGICKLP